MKNTWLKISRYGTWVILLMITMTCFGETEGPVEYEDNEVQMRLVIRSKEQLSAFYAGREFPKNAIDEILKICFITPVVHNKIYEVMWVEPDSWMFTIDNKPVERIKREYWKKIWKETGLSLAHQSTFGWTLMPETRDLRLDESVGGSITIPMQSKPFTLKMHFNTGLNKEGKAKVIEFKDISCAN